MQKSERRGLWSRDNTRLGFAVALCVTFAFSGLITALTVSGMQDAKADHQLESDIQESCAAEGNFSQCMIEVGLVDFCERQYDDEDELACMNDVLAETGSGDDRSG